MGIFKKAFHSKIDVFVKFESAINLEIRGQIKKKPGFLLFGHRDHMYAFSSKSGSEPFRALGDLTWNDPGIWNTGALISYRLHTVGRVRIALII